MLYFVLLFMYVWIFFVYISLFAIQLIQITLLVHNISYLVFDPLLRFYNFTKNYPLASLCFKYFLVVFEICLKCLYCKRMVKVLSPSVTGADTDQLRLLSAKIISSLPVIYTVTSLIYQVMNNISISESGSKWLSQLLFPDCCFCFLSFILSTRSDSELLSCQ